MPTSSLTIERDGRVAVVTINRPDKLNALNQEVIGELGDTFAALNADDAIGGIILTGAGTKAFVAGADIAELAGQSPQQGQARARFGQRVFAAIERSGKPVIAAVNGFALGGGCELAMACHLRIAARSARFGQPEVKLGLCPGYGGTVRLPQLVGQGRALELLLTGAMIGADEAWRIGLVNKVVDDAELLAESRSLLATILGNAPLALAACIASVTDGANLPQESALALEAAHFGVLSGTDDMHAGTDAFLRRSTPEFQGK